jgi:hypothetical protein
MGEMEDGLPSENKKTKINKASLRLSLFFIFHVYNGCNCLIIDQIVGRGWRRGKGKERKGKERNGRKEKEE